MDGGEEVTRHQNKNTKHSSLTGGEGIHTCKTDHQQSFVIISVKKTLTHVLVTTHKEAIDLTQTKNRLTFACSSNNSNEPYPSNKTGTTNFLLGI